MKKYGAKSVAKGLKLMNVADSYIKKYTGISLKESTQTAKKFVNNTVDKITSQVKKKTNSNVSKKTVNEIVQSSNKRIGELAEGSISTQTLFRGERSSVSPDVAFKKGFTSKGTHNNVEQHVTSNTTAGNFISTTSDKVIAQQFAGKNGYVYEIKSSNYVDVNKTLGSKSPFPEQMEFSIPSGVKPSQIKGAWVMKGGKLTGEFIPNPGFTGGN
jgi:hypothetical protein